MITISCITPMRRIIVRLATTRLLPVGHSLRDTYTLKIAPSFPATVSCTSSYGLVHLLCCAGCHAQVVTFRRSVSWMAPIPYAESISSGYAALDSALRGYAPCATLLANFSVHV